MSPKSIFSRRSFMQVSAAATAVAAFRVVHEPMVVRADWQGYPSGAVRIDSTSVHWVLRQRLGKRPLPLSRTAGVITMISPGSSEALFAQQCGLRAEYVRAYAGSSSPLSYAVFALTSARKELCHCRSRV